MKLILAFFTALFALNTQAALIEQESNTITILSVSTGPGDAGRGGCHDTTITVLVTEDAYRDAAGFGLYEGSSQRFSSNSERFQDFAFYSRYTYLPNRIVTLKNGKGAYGFQVTKRYFCWRGSMSSSSNYEQHVKPYVLYYGKDGNTYRVWERGSNYRLHLSDTDFDNSSRLLQ